jgi:hypothetical protein
MTRSLFCGRDGAPWGREFAVTGVLSIQRASSRCHVLAEDADLAALRPRMQDIQLSEETACRG